MNVGLYADGEGPAGSGGAAVSPRANFRPPILAEMVAEVLRERIVNGEYDDGGMLPKQSELIDEFRVSKPSMREALRILEAEGVISIRRGNVGGALVHRPTAASAAYMFGLVLQSSDVSLSDLAAAVRRLEPVCASLCAEREDRAKAVVPKLRKLLDDAAASIDDPVQFTRLSREFHEAIVSGSGNETIRVIIGSLESLWSAHEEHWAARAESEGKYPAAELRAGVLRAHKKIVSMIEKGDISGAARVAREHLSRSQAYALEKGTDRRIKASELRRWR